jgi:hypothetical protein
MPNFLPPLSFVAKRGKERFWHHRLLSFQSKSNDKNAKRQKRESSYVLFFNKAKFMVLNKHV